MLAFNAEDSFAPGSAQTFSAYARNWWVPGSCTYLKAAVNNGSQIRSHHASVQRSYLTVHIIPCFGKMRLSAIGVRHIGGWRLKLCQSVNAANVFGTLCTMLNEAERLALTGRGPIRSVKPTRVTTPRRMVLSAEEVKE